MADTSTSVHQSCLTAVQSVIQGKALANIPSAQVYVRKLPSDRNVTLPAIIVSPPGQETEKPPWTGMDDIGYPVVVTLLQAADQDLSANLERWLIWRQTIYRAFRHQRLAGVAEIFTCEVEPGPIFDAGLFLQQNLDVGTLTLRFFSREPRG